MIDVLSTISGIVCGGTDAGEAGVVILRSSKTPGKLTVALGGSPVEVEIDADAIELAVYNARNNGAPR